MEISPIVLIIWGELTFLMAGGLILLLISRVLGKQKEKKSVAEMMEKIRADREARKMDIRKGLAHYGLKDDSLEAKVNEIDKRERKFYQRIAHMYRDHSDSMLATLNVALEGTVKPYYELDVQIESAAQQPVEAQQPVGVDPAEMEALHKQNEDLQKELAVTMETIGRMLSEYSSMFGSEEAEGLDKAKIMEAFEVDESPELSEDEAQEEVLEEDLEEDLGLNTVEDAEQDMEDVEIVSEVESDETDEEELDVDSLFESAQSEDELPDVSEDDIDDILSGTDVPDDELLEIGDEPILTSTLDDQEDEILSDLVDLEADFGDPAQEPSQTDAIDDLDIDALLENNKG